MVVGESIHYEIYYVDHTFPSLAPPVFRGVMEGGEVGGVTTELDNAVENWRSEIPPQIPVAPVASGAAMWLSDATCPALNSYIKDRTTKEQIIRCGPRVLAIIWLHIPFRIWSEFTGLIQAAVCRLILAPSEYVGGDQEVTYATKLSHWVVSFLKTFSRASQDQRTRGDLTACTPLRPSQSVTHSLCTRSLWTQWSIVIPPGFAPLPVVDRRITCQYQQVTADLRYLAVPHARPAFL
ncbi:hypothetical protein J6590_043500 [Homalodisca vitripennis]|nr:hypothetical protein J6590_043500 [Homalodisca vitripennis]